MALYDVSTTEKKAAPSLVAGGTLYADSPVGTILPFGGANPPSGFLLCQGQEVSKTTYAELYAVIGDSFGTASDATKFVIPDMRESVPKGAGLTGNSSNHMDADGLEVGEFLDDRIKSHKHGITDPGHKHGGYFGTSSGNRGGDYSTVPVGVTQSTNSATTGITINNSGSATNEVKSVGVNYIIKAKMIGVPADFLAKVDEAVVEKNEYSTTETVVGKWIDGKPIYRKVFYSATNWASSTVVGTISNLDMVIGVRDICSADGAYMQNYGADAAGTTQRTTVNKTTGAVTVYRSVGFVNNNPSTVIVEYTKTTD